MFKHKLQAHDLATGQQTGTNIINGDGPQYRDNPEINVKIDNYIAHHQREWEYISQMPRERLQRRLILREVEKLEHKLRMEQRTIDTLNENPEIKLHCENIVKDLPEEQKKKMLITIARGLRQVHQQKIVQSQTQNVAESGPSIKITP